MMTKSALCTVSLIALVLCAMPGRADDCQSILNFLSDKAVGVVCFHADDLRVPNPPTQPVTPANDSLTTFADGTALPGLLSGFGSFSPVTDLGVISNGPTPSANPVPGIQVEGWFADDPAGEARFLLRFPDNWNGKLVVAGASGTRSEYNGDWAWSDYVLPKGYAYASQNKGVLNLFLVSLASATQPSADSSSCRLNPSSSLWVHFYDNDVDGRKKPFTQWTEYMLLTARLAQHAAKAHYNHYPHRTYAVGTSNGGYQVRRAMETGPDLFDGGVDWEGTFIDPRENILVTLPPAIKNWPDYVASNFDPNSAAAQAIEAAGYPPDIVNTSVTPTDSLWKRYWGSFWEVTQCQWQKRFDPGWQTYTGGVNDITGTGGYNFFARAEDNESIEEQLEAVTTTGKIKKPLITVAGTMDALLPIKKQARKYEEKVNASRRGNNEQRNAQYRLYEVQNGNHIESYALIFPQLQVIQPHAQKAFDLLVDHVENHAPLPPSQCIPRGGAISSSPTQAGHCSSLFVP